ncbi:MAG: FAD-binding protein [Candidatus Anammoxibacter sp.]
MNYIVLVKQVPDVTQITGNAFNPETGNLNRGALPSVINKLDADALAFADKMRESSPGNIICLTMGPPMAIDVLRYSLSRCADNAVLLSDRALGGADTPSTANPLAYAVRKIAKEMFDGKNDFVVISGMQSVDGDTAQVPPQIAAELQIPCIAYATDFEFTEGNFVIKTIVSGGNQSVTPGKFPCVITVAGYEYPLFARFDRSRWANNVEIISWSADDIKPTLYGYPGSRTKVTRVFPPPKSTRRNKHVTDIDTFISELVADFKKGGTVSNYVPEEREYILPAVRSAGTFDRGYEASNKDNEAFNLVTKALAKLKITDIDRINETTAERLKDYVDGNIPDYKLKEMLEGFKATQPSYSGDVWVIAEHDRSKIHNVTLELLGKAVELARSLNVRVGGVLIGNMCKQMATEIIAYGADDVYVVEHKLLDDFRPGPYMKAVTYVINRYKPQIVLSGATPQGRVLTPMVAYSLNCGLTADCTRLDIRDNTRQGDIAILMQTRPALGGNVMATICAKDSKLQMATARPGVMKKINPDYSRTGKIITDDVALDESDIGYDIVSAELSGGIPNLTTADIIVSGGRGLRNREKYDKLLKGMVSGFRKKLGCEVEFGASRAAVEHGFIGRPHQVGQTGTAVSPKLYIAIGISGAIQHVIGIENSDIIVAVNSDPKAPIFKYSDYYIIGNAEEIIPKITNALNK